MSNKVTPFDFYKFNTKFGILKTLAGIDYHRYLEYPITYNNLEITNNLQILDVGTGKMSIFPAFIAYHNDCIVYATDIGEYIYSQIRRCKRIKRLKEKIENKKLIFEQQDATSLGYKNTTFDRVSAISTIEHIPNDGDTKAIKEISRVLKKGGIFTVTLPYSYNNYFEQYLRRKVYTREYNKKEVFFARYYDDKALEERIINADEGLSVKNIEYLGDIGVEFYYKLWLNIPFRSAIKYLIGFILPLFSYLFFKRTNDKKKTNVVAITFNKL